MGSRNEVSSCVQEEECTKVGDADKQRIAETFSRHDVRGTATVTVRELRSEGLSFQLWPVANAMCLYIEKELGEGGSFMIDARPSFLERDIARWDNSCAADLDRNLPIVDRFSEGFENNVVVDNEFCSVTDNAVGLGSSNDRNGRRKTSSNGRPEAEALQEVGKLLASTNVGNQMGPLQLLQEIERPVASGNIDTQMDRVVADFDTTHRQTMDCIKRSGVDNCETRLSLGVAEAGCNIHFPRRRMRLLELGSGTGMVGIVAACLGAQVVLTDLPHVLANLSHNLDLNKGVIEAAGGSAEAKVLRWGVEEDVKALGERSFDLILASDCVYHDTSYKPFLNTLNWLTRSPDMDHTDISTTHQRKPNIQKVVSSAFTSQLFEPALSLLPLTETVVPVANGINPYDKVSGNGNGQQPASQIDTARRSVSRKPALSSDTKEQQGNQRRASNDCIILLGHMRRWKKDSKFFRMASKLFDVGIVHRHPPGENDRIGPIIYRLSPKSDSKTSSSRTRSTSSIGSLSCSPSRS